ncbi:hypothetical protein HS088_TW22G00539 [Tripterygium wilfordii]|uniref:Uncharacterized protein n=1 Tax=Tripterygium wilfordii TaxID=458696 RepID=A0A7J7BYU1_TRIWF|nr:uncharacterized protein LOC119991688 isoform X2 [Tripterygium wilfordii]KAF5726855.1 hypothetical protein HS088_TW22G00539 [Tripterygium wilfordii]
MPRTEFKAKSGRKALRDLSNNGGGSGRLSKSVNAQKKASAKDMEDRRVSQETQDDDGPLDRLMLVHSDLSSLLRQIDELVVQAFKLKGTSKERRKEIESFSNVMSDMLSSLKPWVPRFRKLFSSPSMENATQLGQSLVKLMSPVKEVESKKVHSPEPSTLDSLISPSPLVSWRNDCHIERGRQIFQLTPLPISKALSSKHLDSSKLKYGKNNCYPVVELPSFLNIPEDANDDLLEGMAVKTSPEKHHPVATEKKSSLLSVSVSTPMFSKKNHPLLVMTPCLKMSPPRSCLLLEPKIDSSYHGNQRTSKCTPFNFVNHSEIPESSSSEGSKDLALKYPELLGIKETYRSRMVKKEVEASPNWLFSPPKSCVLLEPLDEKSLDNVAISSRLPIDSCVSNHLRTLSISTENVQGGAPQTNKSFNQGTIGGATALIESTPTCKEPESTFRTGKRPGENTLKKELWTKFEAASTYGLRFNATTCPETATKGFLDRLDEVSCDEESTMPDGLR